MFTRNPVMPNQRRRLILASSSKYRAELLHRLGLKFEQWSPEIDESPRLGETPRDLAARLATAKARAVSLQAREAWVIGSDQVASLDGTEPIGKPGTAERAMAQLRKASGNTMLVYTGLSLQCAELNLIKNALDIVEVQFRQLSEAQITYYVDPEKPLDCAGSVKSEALGGALLAKVSNEDPSSLIGLPLIKLCNLFEAVGLDILSKDQAFA